MNNVYVFFFYSYFLNRRFNKTKVGLERSLLDNGIMKYWNGDVIVLGNDDSIIKDF